MSQDAETEEFAHFAAFLKRKGENCYDKKYD